MKQELFEVLRNVKQASRQKSKRTFADFFSDRLAQAFVKNNILDALENLQRNLDVEIQYISRKKM